MEFILGYIAGVTTTVVILVSMWLTHEVRR